MVRWIAIGWAFNTIALWVAARLVDGIEYDDKILTLIIAGLVFAIVGYLVKPLVKLLSLPLIILSFGLFLFVIDLFMLYLTSWLVSGFEVETFGAAILGTIIVWVVNMLLRMGFNVDKK